MHHGVSENVPNISCRTSRMSRQHTKLSRDICDTPCGQTQIIRADDAFETLEKQGVSGCLYVLGFLMAIQSLMAAGSITSGSFAGRALYGQTLPMPLC